MFKPYLFWQGKTTSKARGKQSRAATAKIRKKPQARRNEQPERMQIDIDRKWVVAVAAVMLVTLALYLMPKEQWLPIEKIRISGKFQQLDTQAMQQQLQPYLGQGFFALDIQQIQHTISQQAWVKHVSVRRIWPNQIYVKVQEKTAAARWDDKHLLSSEAVIFPADTTRFAQLPKINGYSKQTRELLERYSQLQQRFDALSLRLTSMVEDNKGSLRLELDKGLQVSLGAGDTATKIGHLLAVYPQHIAPKLDYIEQIDFRYSNGFAIAWKQQYLDKMQRGSNNV